MERGLLPSVRQGSQAKPAAARRFLVSLAALAGVVAIAGCAALNQFSADVATFGAWPAGRLPGSYAFDRLPSQQARAQAQQELEDAAGPALAKAGFRPVAGGAQPDVLVQVGARVSRAERSPWDDPVWWHGGFGGWRHNPWRGPHWIAYGGLGWGRYEAARYEREVALLIRDRSSGQPLYEARASSEGLSSAVGMLLQPLYLAAMANFPATANSPHRVTVSIGP